jgi:hypothetical protein
VFYVFYVFARVMAPGTFVSGLRPFEGNSRSVRGRKFAVPSPRMY